MNEQAWLLTVGEYDEFTVLGVFLGEEDNALVRAMELTYERAKAYRNWPSDLIEVSVEKTEILS